MKKFEIMVELYSLIANFTNKILILSYSHSKDIGENIETDFYDLRMFLKLNAIFLIEFKDDLKNHEKMCFDQIENLK